MVDFYSQLTGITVEGIDGLDEVIMERSQHGLDVTWIVQYSQAGKLVCKEYDSKEAAISWMDEIERGRLFKLEWCHKDLCSATLQLIYTEENWLPSEW